MQPQRTPLIVARRVAEARWALAAAIEAAPELEADIAIGAGRLEQARDLASDVLTDIEPELDRDAGESARPWRQSAAGYHTPAEVVVAVETILETAGGMLVHPANTDRSVESRLTRLDEEIERHRSFPLAFDSDLLVHHALTIALALTLADAGSAEHLRRYGVEPEDDD